MREVIYYVDIMKQNYNYKACMQNDDLEIKVNVYNNSLAYDLTNSTINLNWVVPDGTPLTKNNLEKENNVIIIKLNKNFTEIKGKAKFELEIINDGKMTTFPLEIIIVQKSFQSEAVSNKIIEVLETIQMDEYVDEFLDGIKKKQAELSSQIDEKANLLNARMDTFTTLSEGSTTADAELKDIRVGADGTTYENAGNAVREQFNELKEDLDDIKEPFVKSNEDAKDTLYVTDSEGNVICKIDKDGVHSVNFYNKDGVLINASGGGITEEQAELLNSLSAKYNDGFYVTDADGNVVFKIDRDGVNAVGLTYAMSPYYGRKLLSLGDSLSAQTYMSNKSNTWQSQLAKMVGMVFDYSLNINGDGTHQALAIGGTAILPTMENSIYLRAYDVKHYNDNGDGNSVIFVYAGQNDRIYPSGGSEKDGIVDENILGTIDDEPLSTETVISNMVTFYSRYKGMVEILMRENKKAKIVLVTLMKCRITLGDENTEETIKNIDTVRFAKVQAVREIADFYGLELVDLWSKSGVNHFNSDVFFRTDGDIQVHHNELGATKIAECSYATIM